MTPQESSKKAPSLPASPDLHYYKNRAKELLRAHKAADRLCCTVLREHAEFAGMSDDAILAAKVSLAKAQHAVACSNSFKNWRALKAHIEAKRATQTGDQRNEMMDLLDHFIQRDATDMHLEVGKPRMFRVKGILEPFGAELLTADDTQRLMKSITSDDHQARIAERGYISFGFSYGDRFGDRMFFVTVSCQNEETSLFLRGMAPAESHEGWRYEPEADTEKLRNLLYQFEEQEATDMYLVPGQVPTIRVGGRIKQIDVGKLTDDETRSLALAVTSEGQRKQLEEEGYTSLPFQITTLRSRTDTHVTITKRNGKYELIMRFVPPWERDHSWRAISK